MKKIARGRHTQQRLADGGERAFELAPGEVHHRPAQEAPKRRVVILVDDAHLGEDIRPAFHEIFNGAVGAERAVGDDQADVVVLGGGENRGAGAARDAEDTDFAGELLLFEPLAHKRQRAAQVVQFTVADPLAGRVVGFGVGFAMPAKVEGEYVVADFDQRPAIARAGTHVGAIFVCEDHRAASRDVRIGAQQHAGEGAGRRRRESRRARR